MDICITIHQIKYCRFYNTENAVESIFVLNNSPTKILILNALHTGKLQPNAMEHFFCTLIVDARWSLPGSWRTFQHYKVYV